MARAGLEPGTVGLQVRRADHSATLPPQLTSQPKPSQWPFVDSRVWAGTQTSADQTEAPTLICRGTGIPERGNAKPGNPQDTKHPFRGICLRFCVAVEHPTCKSPERGYRVAGQVCQVSPQQCM